MTVINNIFQNISKTFDMESFPSFSTESLKSETGNGEILIVKSPIDQSFLATIKITTQNEYEKIVSKLKTEQKIWKNIPAPRRGEVIRLFGNELRKSKTELGTLVSIESGKILQEGLGEVQEMIDICDFAVGLSRQLYGLTMPSERPSHRIQEVWHPLGLVGIVSSFNFPVAVWSWNFALATVCGNATLWKPSPKTPLTSIACHKIWKDVIKLSQLEDSKINIFDLIFGDKIQAEWISNDKNVDLVSLTGSTQMGKTLGPQVTKRFGKLIMELGGNNAMIVTPSADIELATRAIIFSSVGTCGQRCTTLRRVIVHNSIIKKLISNLKKYYKTIKIGNPLAQGVLIGPLINEDSFNKMQDVLEICKNDGAEIFGGDRLVSDNNGIYVNPAIVELDSVKDITKQETFAPVLFIIPYENLNDAIHIQNDVPQGLSSCIFSRDLIESEKFIGPTGSDCGIVNVNVGPSGAEIGGAFGGEKETGGGRESGSDAWKSYMRRVTITTNYSNELPLSQGINFEI